MKTDISLNQIENFEDSEIKTPELPEDEKEFEDISFKKFEPEITKNTFHKFLKKEVKEEFKKFATLEEDLDEFPIKTPVQKNFSKQNGTKEKFHWKPAITQSLYFLGIQHGFRMFQKKTTDEFRGEFFNDWGKSIRNLEGWRDGDTLFTNYVAHPMQGAVTGRIFINNSDKSKKYEFGESKEYWESRAKAMVWSAIWSVQFEMGPISEATIGNVGIRRVNGYSTMAWVDLVMTPVAGTGVLIFEDIIDKYILKNWLEKGAGRNKVKILRTFFTPFQSFTNILRGRSLWVRDTRF